MQKYSEGKEAEELYSEFKKLFDANKVPSNDGYLPHAIFTSSIHPITKEKKSEKVYLIEWFADGNIHGSEAYFTLFEKHTKQKPRFFGLFSKNTTSYKVIAYITQSTDRWNAVPSYNVTLV